MNSFFTALIAAETGTSNGGPVQWLKEIDWTSTLGTIGTSLLILLGFYIVARILQATSVRVGSNRHINEDLARFMGRVVKVIILIMGLVTALSNLGVDVSALVAGLGLTGFALGFALKDVISNVLAGVLILIYKPFIKGDSIKVKGYEGEVISTDLRYTVLMGEEGVTLYVPNSILFVDAIQVAPRPTAD